MKKLLVLISFLFVTVCYAAPPPDFDHFVDNTKMVSQQDVTVTTDVAVYTLQRIEAQEVAYSYIGNPEVFTGTANYFEYEATLTFADLPEIYNDSRLTALNKPPSVDINVGVKMLVANKQHSNFGYPFTADRCRRGIVPA